jgi:hypothetical protein
MKVRPPAVAGSFYPDDPAILRATVQRLLDAADAQDGAPPPKAIVVPHAGYIYSGAVAAEAFARVRASGGQVRRVVLLGPAHTIAFAGAAVPDCDAMATPLGRVTLDVGQAESLATLPGMLRHDAPHRGEHCLEVELPFLQLALRDFRVLPVVVGDAPPALVDAILDAAWGSAETLIVISSDLSHYRRYAAARHIDAETATAIERLDPDPIDHEHACGATPLAGLLRAAGRRGLAAARLALANSGDTAGDRVSVVGYGAWAFA